MSSVTSICKYQKSIESVENPTVRELIQIRFIFYTGLKNLPTPGRKLVPIEKSSAQIPKAFNQHEIAEQTKMT